MPGTEATDKGTRMIPGRGDAKRLQFVIMPHSQPGCQTEPERNELARKVQIAGTRCRIAGSDRYFA